jgi:predicted nucleotidyltransferase
MPLPNLGQSLDTAPLSPVDRLAIRDAAARLAAAVPVERIVLFGSKARGDDDEESDIDLLVITSRPLDQAEGREVVGCLQPVQAAHRVIFSPLRVSAEEWYHGVYQVLPIRKEIDREGIDVELLDGLESGKPGAGADFRPAATPERPAKWSSDSAGYKPVRLRVASDFGGLPKL